MPTSPTPHPLHPFLSIRCLLPIRCLLLTTTLFALSPAPTLAQSITLDGSLGSSGPIPTVNNVGNFRTIYGIRQSLGQTRGSNLEPIRKPVKWKTQVKRPFERLGDDELYRGSPQFPLAR
jgi:hypothetical protein